MVAPTACVTTVPQTPVVSDIAAAAITCATPFNRLADYLCVIIIGQFK